MKSAEIKAQILDNKLNESNASDMHSVGAKVKKNKNKTIKNKENMDIKRSEDSKNIKRMGRNARYEVTLPETGIPAAGKHEANRITKNSLEAGQQRGRYTQKYTVIRNRKYSSESR